MRRESMRGGWSRKKEVWDCLEGVLKEKGAVSGGRCRKGAHGISRKRVVRGLKNKAAGCKGEVIRDESRNGR